MRRLAGWLALVGLAGASPVQAQAWREVMALGKPEPTVLRENGIEVTVDSVTEAASASADATETPDPGEAAAPEDTTRVRVTALFPSAEPLELPADAMRNDAYPISVGIGPMNAAGDPAVIVEGYSGGVHCCATFQMMARVDGAVVALGLPPMDGSPGTEFPTDIDGDGIVDIRRTDDSFLYSFSSYAASVAVPKIYNLLGSTLVDVSAEPRYAPLWRAFAEETLPACTDRESGERNGACAAYAAAKARLGEADDGIATAVRNAAEPDWLPEPCTVEVTRDGCPTDKTRHFADFEEALRWMLQDRGYLGVPAPIPYLDLEPPAGFPPFPAAEAPSQPPVDRPAAVGHEEGVGLAEVPAPQEP